jgi:hypothetical protein
VCVSNKKENDLIGSLEGLPMDRTCRDLKFCFFGADGGNQSIKKDCERYIEGDNDWHFCGKWRLENNQHLPMVQVVHRRSQLSGVAKECLHCYFNVHNLCEKVLMKEV